MAKKRITLDLDESLLHRLDTFAGERSLSRNQFVVESVLAALNEAARRRIDLEFAAIKDDPDYCRELSSVEAELSPESDRAWGLLDKQESAFLDSSR